MLAACGDIGRLRIGDVARLRLCVVLGVYMVLGVYVVFGVHMHGSGC